MAGVTLDAGPLIALERRDRAAEEWLDAAIRRGVVLSVPAAVVAEVWRGGSRSARIARLLNVVTVEPVDERLARRAGELLAATGSAATIDALMVVSAARRHDTVLTTDPGDVGPLASAAGIRLAVL